MPAAKPNANIIIREHRGQPFYEAKFRHDGKQIKRRIGPAWLERDPDSGAWRRRRGRIGEGAFDERAAIIAAAEIVERHVSEAAEAERVLQERRTRGVTFREVAHSHLRWLADIAGAKPSTLQDRESLLGEPGLPVKRGKGTTRGHVMAALGDRPASKITTREINDLLATISATGTSASTVNKYRSAISAVFNHGCKPAAFALPSNPVNGADKRREPSPGALVFYSPDEIEAIARALADGLHRDPAFPAVTESERLARQVDDQEDAELVRVAAYAGLRQGELLALRWRDVDFAGSALTVARAMSAGVESSTKSGRVRRVPLADQAAAALDRLSRRGHYTASGELVFCNVLGRPLDGSALRRRYRRAQLAAGVRPLRFHDLRHTFGSLLASRGVDVVTIQKAMGHSALSTTSRYLHARPTSEQARHSLPRSRIARPNSTEPRRCVRPSILVIVGHPTKTLIISLCRMTEPSAHQDASAEIPAGPAWLPPKEPPSPIVQWVNGRSLPAVWRDTLPFVMGGLVAAQKDFPQLKLGSDWSSEPKPDSDQDVYQAIAAKLHIGLRLGTVLADAQLAVIDPSQVVVIPEWQSSEEAAAYACIAQLPTSPIYLDLEGDDGQPSAWEAETWPPPFHLRGALCWTAENLLSIIPFGSVGGVHLCGGTDYQAWARWSFTQEERSDWPRPGPGDFIATADGRVASWVDIEDESVCAHYGAIAFNLTTRVLRILWALQTFAIPLELPHLPRAERRRAKRANQEVGLVAARLPRPPTQMAPDADATDDEPVLVAQCPVQNAHSRLNQAHILWHEALDAYNDPEAFVAKVNALIQAMRNVTFGLQNDMSDSPGMNDWYEGWQERMRSDRRMVWLKNARTQIVHKDELETHSKVRVMVVGEMLRGTPVELDIGSTAPVNEIARHLNITGVTGRIAREGTLVVERRWTVDALPNDELLDALAHCYGVLTSILEEAHNQVGTSIEVCEVSGGDPCGWTKAFTHPGGRPGCMWANKEARTSRRDLSTGAPVQAMIVSARGPDISLEAIQERYGLKKLESMPEGTDVIEQARFLHEKGRKMLAVDGEHIMIAWLSRDGVALSQLTLAPEDQREKYLIMDAVASEVRKLGANELILSSEAWEAPAVSRNDPRSGMRAAERDDRTESFLTHVVTRDGRSLTLRSRIERTEQGVTLTGPEEAPPLMRPLLEAWAEWPS